MRKKSCEDEAETPSRKKHPEEKRHPRLSLGLDNACCVVAGSDCIMEEITRLSHVPWGEIRGRRRRQQPRYAFYSSLRLPHSSFPPFTCLHSTLSLLSVLFLPSLLPLSPLALTSLFSVRFPLLSTPLFPLPIAQPFFPLP